MRLMSKFNPEIEYNRFDWVRLRNAGRLNEDLVNNIHFNYKVIDVFCEKCQTLMVWCFPSEYVVRGARETYDEEIESEIERIKCLDFGESIDTVFDEILEKNICPLCGKKLLSDQFLKNCNGIRGEGHQKYECYNEKLSGLVWVRGDTYWAGGDGRMVLDDDESKMKEAREKAAEARDPIYGEEEAKAFCEDSRARITTGKQVLTNFDMNDIDLPKYILDGLDIEKAVCLLEFRIKELFTRHRKTSRSLLGAKKEIESIMQEGIDGVEEEYEEMKKKIEKRFSIEEEELPSCPVKPELTAKEPEKPVFQKAGFLNKKKIMELNASMEKEYENNVAKYKKTLEEYTNAMNEYSDSMIRYKIEKERIENENREKSRRIAKMKIEELRKVREEKENRINEIRNSNIMLPAVVLNNLVEEELEEAKALYIKLIEARENFYAPGVIFDKYRNLSALSTMCEYIQSGRCEKLSGADGAYNLYETELRANLIIDKLDTVIDKLDEIANNQYTLCTAMRGIRYSLNSIDRKMSDACNSLGSIDNKADRLLSYTKSIAKNSAITAYYAEKTAFYSQITATASIAALFMK